MHIELQRYRRRPAGHGLLLVRAALCALLAAPGLAGGTDASDSSSTTAREDGSSVPRLRIRFLELGADARFNYMDREKGPVTDRGLQYRVHSLIRTDLAADGSTYILLRAETGKGFDNSWDNTGAGIGKGQSIFNVKSLALVHRFGDRFTAQAGGLDFDRGVGTDSIYASGDGYITGYRAVYTPPSNRFPAKVSLTAAYLGDFDKPNFFSRARMDRLNYVQVLVEQQLSENLRGSAELDSIHDAVFSRAALHQRRLWGLDDPTIEAVARMTGQITFAWAASISHRWGIESPWRTNLIYADLPARMYEISGQRMLLNRGEIDLGKRLAFGTGYQVRRDCEIDIFAGRLLDATPSKRWIAQVGVHYQFAGMVNRLLK